MSEENYVGLNKAIIPGDAVRKMSNIQKRQYLMITNMLRDLNLLQKLLLFVRNNDNMDEATESANVTISFFLLKTLISKNHEMWNFAKQEGMLSENLNGQLNRLKNQIIAFFSDKKNQDIFSFVRNKFGFHYEADPKYKKELENLIGPAMDGHEMDMWLSNADSGNEIFSSSNAIMLKVIFERMRNNGFVGDDKALMGKLFNLTLNISRIFHDFYKFYLIENILAGITLQDTGELRIKAPLLSQTKLTLLVKCDRENGLRNISNSCL